MLGFLTRGVSFEDKQHGISLKIIIHDIQNDLNLISRPGGQDVGSQFIPVSTVSMTPDPLFSLALLINWLLGRGKNGLNKSRDAKESIG